MKNVPFLKMTLGIIIFIMPLITVFSQQNLSATEIVKRADDNMRGKTSEADITIKIIRPTWSESRKFGTGFHLLSATLNCPHQ